MEKVEGLQEHIAELGVANTGIPVLHSSADTFFGDHHIDRKVLADFPKKVEIADRRGPVRIVQELGRVLVGLKIKEAGQLRFYFGDIIRERFAGEKLSLGSFSAGIAD